MAVVRALHSGTGALRRNPSIAGIVLVISLLQLPTQLAQAAGPVAAAVVGLGVSLLSILLVPFVFAGLLGMADEAIDGATSLGTFVEAGKRHYVSMLGAYFLILGGSVVLGVVAFVAFSVLGFAAFAALGGASGAGVSGVTLAGLALAVVAGTLLLFVPLVFVQFYGQAIVLDGSGAVGGLTRSIVLVRRNLRSVLGYSALVFGVGLVFGLVTSVPSTLLSLQTAQPSPSPGVPGVPLSIVVGLTVAGAVLMGLLGSLFLTFSVAFYRTLDPTVNGGDSATQGEAATRP